MDVAKETIKTKAFKLSESDLKQTNEMLSKLEGANESEKLISALQSALALENKNEALESLPKDLSKVFQGDFAKIATSIATIQAVFDTLLFTVSEELTKRERLIEEKHLKQAEALKKDKDLLNEKIQNLNKIIDAQVNELTDNESVINNLTLENTELTNREESYLKQIEELKSQIQTDKEESKQHIEELKHQLSNRETELAYQVEDSRKYKDKIELLEQKNNKISDDYNKVNLVNNRLTNENNMIEFKYNSAKEQITAIKEELENERKSKSELQKELLELMKSMSKTSEPVEQKQQQKKRYKFKVLDHKGKKIFEGNKQEFLKHVNSLNRGKVDSNTPLDKIEEIIHPWTIETV